MQPKCVSTRDTGGAILGPDLETGMTLRPNALPTNVPRWDAQSPRVATTAPLTSKGRTRGQNMELHKRYSTSASASHGTVAKKRKTWSFITSSSEPQNLKKTHESRLLGYFRETLQVKERQTKTLRTKSENTILTQKLAKSDHGDIPHTTHNTLATQRSRISSSTVLKKKEHTEIRNNVQHSQT